ncbi:exodeoxyribonuclease V subunit beta [Buchnera aphidicola (Ceratoglyphina bambusae)]|uniref:exodeoxyribonuclease V subunit beta n=1 Tax=Buchnera aphidicola TaxID=9 RepID=UPI0031B8023B
MIKKLNPLKINFLENSLIESSAGTGKTFNIVILFLRLILQINVKNKHINNINIKKILILTFTKYSKKEIYKKIKYELYNFKKDCMKQKSKNVVYNKIIKKIKSFNNAIKILSNTEENIHSASIFTIHQFCNKIIRRNTFIFKNIFKKNIMKKEKKIFLKYIIKFWRKNFYSTPMEITKIIYNYWNEPKKIFKEVKNILKNNINIKKNKKFHKNTIKSYHFCLIKKITIFKKNCYSSIKILKKIIYKLKKNKKGYKKLLKIKKIIQTWYEKKTKNYFVPKEIINLIKTKNIEKYKNYNKKFTLFLKTIKKFSKKKFLMKELIIYKILNEVPKMIKKYKEKKSKLDFDDITKTIEKKIKTNKKLLESIRKKYPIAIIDEFQDTDIHQQRIFKKIYKNKKKNIMILLSDPKQSIYSFRGANIFSYIKFRQEIKKKYYLDVNWRSSPNIVKSVNKIFLNIKYPFIYKEIKYKKIKYKKKNKYIKLKINKLEESNFKILFYNKSEINLEKYFNWASKQCAIQISKWLYYIKLKKAKINYFNKARMFKKRDIVIIVKNYIEANYVKKYLKKYNIKYNYLSEKINIYKTKECNEILILLKSILDISNKKKMINAFSTFILSKSINEIYKISEYKNVWLKQTKIFKKYLNILKKRGILTLIKYLIKKNSKIELIKYNDKFKKYFFISKILEKKKFQIKNFNNLIHWLENKIENTINSNEEYLNKNEEKKSIKILTVHKSKGLEYPVVIIPFIMTFKQKNNILYYNKKNNTKKNINLKKKNKKNINYNLSEDLRLLYVSLTRAIVHCTIILAAIKKKKKSKNTNVHKSSIGYILQKKENNFKNFIKIIKNLNKNKFIEIENKILKKKIYKDINVYTKKIKKNEKKKYIKKNWNITNFSRIKKEIKKINHKNKINNINFKKNKKKECKLNTYNFPRGKSFGKMLHEIIKKYIKYKKVKNSWIEKKITSYNLNKKWLTIIDTWMKNIINKKISKNGIKLRNFKKEHYVQDLEFCIYIKKDLEIRHICNKFITEKKIKLKIFKGMLNGIIDIMFLWKKKYYFIDFKFNYLGNKKECYNKKKIMKSIIKNKYEIQYKIYSIGMHQYLKKKIKNYSFKKHFGGAFYLFLRAFDDTSSKKKYGKIFIRIKENLIKKFKRYTK